MSKLFNKSDQRGTLLVEALAMLGLIAMVTPTLYKKSAERLQEIQDINSASQARTMSSIMDAYIRQNFSGLMSSIASDTSTIVIDYEDNQAGAYRVGYSSYLPYGFTPNEIRGYDMPKVYVHRDNKIHYIRFENGGHTVKPLEEIGTCDDHGTIVTFKPDPTIFKETTIYDFSIIHMLL